MTYLLRPMTEPDLPAVVKIENSWSYLSKWGIPGFRSALANPQTFVCLVGEPAPLPSREANPPASQPLAGFAVLGLMPDHAELCDIVVLPGHLGSGLGQLLLDHCLEIVISRQLPVMFLEVRHSNARAIQFYKKNGFSILSSRKRYYQNPLEDAWVMKKVISCS